MRSVRTAGWVLATTAAMLTASGSAAVPSRMWLGVDRIGIECQFEGPLSSTEKQNLCAAFLEAAGEMTRYPVALAPTDPEPGPEVDATLILNVFVRAEAQHPTSIEVASQPERRGLTRLSGRQTAYLPVALSWAGDKPALTKPVAPLALHLTPPTRDRPMPRR